MNSENQNQNQNPQVVRKVFKELEQLSSESLEGIKLITNDANLLDIQAIIDGPGEFRCCFQRHTNNKKTILRMALRSNVLILCVNCV